MEGKEEDEILDEEGKKFEVIRARGGGSRNLTRYGAI